MTQRDLFSRPPEPPHQSHSPTSREAARSVEPVAETLRRQVLEFLRGLADGGATDQEMQDGLHMHGNTQRPRRIELQQAGLIEDSGRKRQTSSGRQAVVWVAREVGP